MVGHPIKEYSLFICIGLIRKLMTKAVLAGCIILFTACSFASRIQATPDVPLPTRKLTSTWTKTTTRTSTPIPHPADAGFSDDPYQVEYDTPLDQLAPGEYLIVQTMRDIEMDASVSRFRYLDLTGSQNGMLFSIFGETSRGPQSVGYSLKLFGGSDASSLLFLDLESQQIRQFYFGCEDISGMSVSGGTYVAYTCTTSGQVWYVVSLDGGTIESTMFQSTSGFNSLYWIKPDTAIIDNSSNDDNFVGPHPPRIYCILQASTRSLSCLKKAPDWWGRPVSGLSPDGSNVIITQENPAKPGRLIFAILPVDCLEQPNQQGCVPKILEGAEQLMGASLYQEIAWLPDGSKLLILNADRDPWQTTIWLYDMDEDTARKLTTSPGVMHLGPGPWTADGEHFLLIDSATPSDNKIRLVSVVTGGMQRVGAALPGIVYVAGLFQVP
jgi:hypothetical protein